MTSKTKNDPPFYVDAAEEQQLRDAAARLLPSPVIGQATSFDDYVRQLMIPATVLEMARKAEGLRFSTWETMAIRASLADGLLKRILDLKFADDDSHPAYIRVACTGRGDYDHLADEHGVALTAAEKSAQEREESEHGHLGDFGSPVVLELWPARHYSPIHSHGKTTGIIYVLTGEIDVMLYDDLAWDAKKLGLVTLTPGQCAWLTETSSPVHKVYCPMDEGSYAATFHVYLNKTELPMVRAKLEESETRDVFDFIHEKDRDQRQFNTYSDLSWRVLRKVIAKWAAEQGV